MTDQTMGNVLVLMATNRELEPQTRQCVAAMRRLGAAYLAVQGHSDVTQARNHELSLGCEALRNHPERDAVLMLDDDMVVPPETALELVREALASGHACSAAYATAGAKLAGGRWRPRGGGDWTEGLKERWLMGLGCIAIPAPLLLQLERESASYEVLGKVYSEFTWSKAEDGGWVAEDFRLSKRLGGVRLLPIGVGHVKKGELWPDDETIAAIAEGRDAARLPGGAVQA